MLISSRCRVCSDFLVPDYLSQVQEEEEALGVQYELEESQHHPVFPGAASSTTTVTPPSSSVLTPVISQVSSSTQNCESSSGFLSPDPLEASAPFKIHGGGAAGLRGETAMDNGEGGSQEEQQDVPAEQLASITM